MNKWNTLLILLVILVTSFPASADKLVVVVNFDNPTVRLTKSQVIDIYMGKNIAFPDGTSATPVDGPKGSKQQFYKVLIRRNLSQVNAYWSRIRFTGRATPPFAKTENISVLSYVENNINGIGYLPKSMVTNKVKVVYEFD